MNGKIFIFSLVLMLNALGAKAQLTTHPMVYVGYQYQNHHFGDLGLRFLFLKQDDYAFRVSGGALLGSRNESFVAIPKIQTDFLINTEKHVDIQHSYYYLIGSEFSTHSITPKLGISLFGVVDCTAGYAFPIRKDGLQGKELEGVTINCTFNIPWVTLQK